MNEIDLDHLGDVWRAQPDPAELERLRRSAETVRSRARWGQAADLWLALLVSAVVLILTLSNPTVETGLVGAAAIALILISTIRQRRLRALELATLSAPTEQMLDQSILRAQTTVRRAWLSLWMMPPGLLLGLGFGAMLDRGEGSGLLERLAQSTNLKILAAVLISLAAAAIATHLIRIRRQARSELERLIQLREAYAAENAAE